MFSFLFARQNLYVDGDPAAAARNLIEKEAQARWGIAAEVMLVRFQALSAVWLYRLIHEKD